VNGNDRPLDAGDTIHDPADQAAKLIGGGVPDRVRDVDHARPGGDRRSDHLVQKLRLGASGILGGELDLVTILFGVGDHLSRTGEDRASVHVQLIVHVDLGCGDEHVDAGMRSQFHSLPGKIDITRHRPCKGADRGDVLPAAHRLCHLLHGTQFVRGGSREPGLDHVDPQPCKLPR
jgi:hypothetical protein